ncbi:hypothetical protein GCM10009839_58940 [Catenulispora yoronensis]|uniref:Core-binding (CB) domain-containing protein n=1 Tax=Catenulispora yoronensis TaxID=450799 RepID=A0ABN2V0I1_9ACTN
MAQRLTLEQLRVQTVRHGDGGRSYTIFDSTSGVHAAAERYLSAYAGKGSDRTYAYLLLDHLRWLEYEGLSAETVRFRDLERYMKAVGAKVPVRYGSPWRVGKRPYQNDALRGAAACLKGFYLRQAELGVNRTLAEALDVQRLPTQRDRDRAMLGHIKRSMEAVCGGLKWPGCGLKWPWASCACGCFVWRRSELAHPVMVDS